MATIVFHLGFSIARTVGRAMEHPSDLLAESHCGKVLSTEDWGGSIECLSIEYRKYTALTGADQSRIGNGRGCASTYSGAVVQ